MAEAVATFFLEKLVGQLSQEARLLRGVKAEVESVKGELESMKAFLKDADQKRGNTDGVEAWVKEVRLLVFVVEDVVDEYMSQIERNINPSRGGIMGCLTSHACFFKELIARHRTGSQIQKIKENIKQIEERRKRYDFQILPGAGSGTDESERGSRVTYPFIEEADIVGIDSDKRKIEEWVFKREEGGRRSVISVVGMGGSGKTTLVKKIFNNVKNRFYCHAWVSVSKSNKTTELLKDIMKGFHKSNNDMPSLVETENIQERELIEKIYNSLRLEGRQFILVLDDIWEIGVWESLKHALPHESGGKIIFTTRIMDVANPISENYYVHKIQPLSSNLAWELFCKKAFQNSYPRGQACPPELKDLGEGIVKKCKGLPLAVVAIGGLLSKKGTNPSQWNVILQNLDSELIKEDGNLQSLNKALLLSYNYLPFYLRYCFLYCGLFPEDYKIEREKVTLLWVAEGFIHDRRRHNTKTMEEVADDYFMELIDRNMLQVADVNEAGKVLSCKVHDLMRDLAIDIAAKENFGAICCGTQDDRVPEEVSPQRLSVLGDWDNIATNVGKLNPRTILVFGEYDDPPKNRLALPSSLTLLSVLDLRDVRMKSLPVVVCDRMIHLRYLGLAHTWIRELPPSIGKLHRLQTLDIRGGKVGCLPPSINMLHQLRHLFLNDLADNMLFQLWQFLNDLGVTKMPTSGIGNLRCLQTLIGVAATPGTVTELGNFTQLTTLSIKCVTEEVCQELCASVKKMTHLRSLKIQQRDGDESVIQFETLSPPPLYLDELIFIARMERLPDWVGSLNSLTFLTLWGCRLIEDPLSILQHLPQLIYLGLEYNSYMGERMGGCGSTGFPKLRKLRLYGLPLLEEVGRIEEGAMPCLECFETSWSEKLKMLPQGFEHLTSLKRLELRNVDEHLKDNAKELLDGLREDGQHHIPDLIIFGSS